MTAIFWDVNASLHHSFSMPWRNRSSLRMLLEDEFRKGLYKQLLMNPLHHPFLPNLLSSAYPFCLIILCFLISFFLSHHWVQNLFNTTQMTSLNFAKLHKWHALFNTTQMTSHNFAKHHKWHAQFCKLNPESLVSKFD